MRRKFAGIVGAVMVLLIVACSGALAGPRDDVVAHAYEVLNYEWYTSDYILLYSSEFGPTVSNGVLSFNSTPYVAKGNVRGIPYSLSSCDGGGSEKTFSNYKSLSASSKLQKSNRYKYDTTYKVSMLYGMSCATFVTDSILHGLTNKGLYIHTVTNIHTQSGWFDYVSKGSLNDAGYAALQKGDYLYHQNGNHVRLVVENNTSARTITYIDQTPPYGTIDGCTNTTDVWISFSTYDGSATYTGWAKQVCMQCNACKRSTMGTHIATISYSDLPLYPAYYPMYVDYGEDSIPDLPWDGSTVLLNRGDFPIKVYTLENKTYDVYSDKYLRNKLTSNWTDGSEEDWILDVGKNSEGVDYAYISIPLNNGNRKNVYVNLRDIFVKGSLNEPTHVYKDCWDFYRRRGSDYDSSYVLIADDTTIFPLTRDNGWVQVCFWDWGENGGARIAWLTELEYVRITTTPPTITTTSLADAYIGESYYAQVQATGTTPITYTLNSSVPSANGFDVQDWLVGLCTDGIIKGTPGYVSGNPTNRTPPYTVDFPITATNAGGSASKTLSVTVYALPSISYTFKSGKTGETYSDYVMASGGKSSYTWTKNSGTFPPGLSMSPSGSYLYLKGTPTSAGTYTFSLKVKDANGKTATKSFTITITAPPSISTTSLKDGTVGTSYSETLSASGTTPITWSATGLPSGLLCSSAGKITGTPSASGTYTVSLTATNTAGSKTKTLTLTIKEKPVLPTVDVYLPECYAGEEYSGWIRVSGTSPITCSVSGLPSGLSRNSSTGNITGKVTKTWSYTVRVEASNSAGSVSKSYTLTVKARPVKPTITTTSLPAGKVGTAYSATLTASGTASITWTATGLPGGLSCSSAGVISGTPTEFGTFSVSITASNTAGNVSKALSLTVSSGGSSIETPEYDEMPEFRTQSLLLSGQIGLNFYMSLPAISGVDYSDSNCYMAFDVNGDSKSNVPQPYDPEFMNQKKTYYGFRCYINSIQMADPVTATFHYGGGMTVTKTYSAKSYIDTVLGMAGFSDEVRALMSAIKDYGHYMQVFLSQSRGWT
ncbi:MAG: putative Ig domain-containing protein, partial [Synergistaceae bacterium]|nr:putative Ig domain-containing protein [Synergistaceae bacterium]